jgi:hypothetical protein
VKHCFKAGKISLPELLTSFATRADEALSKLIGKIPLLEQLWILSKDLLFSQWPI